MHHSIEKLAIFNVPSLHASLMDTHHDTSSRSILEDDFISLTSKADVCFCSSKGVDLWLVVRPSIYSFCITHYIFILALHFQFNLIHPLAFNLLKCECGHELDAFGPHLARCPFGGQHITTHDTIRNITYAFVCKSGRAVWKKRWYAFMSKVSL
jgi:hypothetical protein